MLKTLVSAHLIFEKLFQIQQFYIAVGKNDLFFFFETENLQKLTIEYYNENVTKIRCI